MTVYVPLWFKIKVQSSFTYGAKLVFETMVGAKDLTEDIQEIVFPSIERNAFFSHPENVIYSMIHDENITIRKLGWRKILKAREQENFPRNPVRVFELPKLIKNCESYYSMIEWPKYYAEPPLTRSIPLDIIRNGVETGSIEVQLPTDIPCHTQSVERHKKLVSEDSRKVCGFEARDGMICCTLESRKKMPVFNTKKDFKL